ncbi:MAG: tetratricopeptide repeat protein [Fulvivirga sp.]|uniref:tetratricopeptide repeat protein n=1 Tax=Fulvivirga sp. TaxID=1931237 RepID=UPI0032EB8349
MKLRIIIFFCLLSSISFNEMRAENLDSLENVLTKTSGIERVQILNKLGFEYAFTSLEKAKKYAYLGYREAKTIDDSGLLVSALINVAYSNYDYNKIDSAEYYFLQAADLARSVNDLKGLANSLNGLGTVSKRKGELASAIKYYKDCLSAQEKVGNTTGISAALHNIGKALNDIGSYEEALKYYLRALEINKNNNYTAKIALNLSNLSLVHINQREEHLALKYLEEILELPSLPHKSLASAYNDLGLVYKKKKEYVAALNYFDKSQKYYDSLGYQSAQVLHNISDTYLDKGDFTSAITIAEEALDLKRKQNNPSSQVFTLNLLADIYLQLGNAKKALEYSEEALAISIKINSKDREKHTLKYISESYALMSDFNTAWQYRLKYESLKDSLFNSQKSEQQAAILTLYETEQKQKKIELQEANLESQEAKLALADVTNSRLLIIISAIILLSIVLLGAFINKNRIYKKLELQKLAIEQKDKEKAVLLKEIHHRVKNNLQIISSILNIQSRKLDDDVAKKAVDEGRSRIKSMSLIHERLYSTDQISSINMKEYIHELSEFLFSTYKPNSDISKNIETGDLELDIDTAIPVGLILNELITNSLKYAFSNNPTGSLDIRLSQDNQEFILQLKDSGPGLPDGFDEKKSMGMRLIRTLAQQLNGLINIENKNGAVVTLTFKPVLSTT